MFKNIMARTALVATTGSMVLMSAAPMAGAASATSNASLSVNVATAIAISVASPTFASSVTPGGAAVSADADVSVDTSDSGGFDLLAKYTPNAGCTAVLCKAGPVNMTDTTTAYDGTAATATAPAFGFSMRVKKGGNTDAILQANAVTRWGDETAGPSTAKYAKPTTSDLEIVTTTSNAAGSTRKATISYNVKANSTQEAGTYTGTINYTATTNNV